MNIMGDVRRFKRFAPCGRAMIRVNAPTSLHVLLSLQLTAKPEGR